MSATTKIRILATFVFFVTILNLYINYKILDNNVNLLATQPNKLVSIVAKNTMEQKELNNLFTDSLLNSDKIDTAEITEIVKLRQQINKLKNSRQIKK